MLRKWIVAPARPTVRPPTFLILITQVFLRKPWLIKLEIFFDIEGCFEIPVLEISKVDSILIRCILTLNSLNILSYGLATATLQIRLGFVWTDQPSLVTLYVPLFPWHVFANHDHFYLFTVYPVPLFPSHVFANHDHFYLVTVYPVLWFFSYMHEVPAATLVNVSRSAEKHLFAGFLRSLKIYSLVGNIEMIWWSISGTTFEMV